MTEPSRDLEAGEGNEADIEDVEDTEDTRKAKLTADLMKDPKVLAALQSKLGIMVGASSGYIENLPACVKRRIKALKKLHVECSKVEAKFHAEVYALECKYAKLYQPFYDKRHQITVGKVEPTDEECDFTTDSDKEEDEISEGIKKAAINEKGDEKKDENVAGIPEFWLTALKNLDLMVDMIQRQNLFSRSPHMFQEHDEEILKHLIDIKVRNLEPNSMGFVLEFHFEPNDFFNNTVLTKSYEVKCEVDDAEPLAFEGPDIVGCKGCVIEWKKGKNVTVKTMKKKQKHKSRGTVRFVTKTMQRDSFFNFFSPPEQQGDTLDEEAQALLAADFEIGHVLKERVVPRAVLYFTGEAIQEDDYDEDEEDEEDEEEDDDEHNEDFDEDDDADPDFVPKSTKKGEPPAECKQQ
ncbi:nucleosome assembly protein 1-like 1-B isoform X1 [Ixodes scapularis]|uniref:nucleosome assembly protein 1-like 1-B isoform X1 n=2 Tax=Ixodes scapularis TaxID=6945 RepID=UPI001161A3EC|nr:nucleosome assembly protein 1-like 1-B isoform X1 [Ixodes scapularis]XP_042142339.1 nucleosome assembly protein 1-like 1-B isoform X1 [Ixodes scapularis]